MRTSFLWMVTVAALIVVGVWLLFGQTQYSTTVSQTVPVSYDMDLISLLIERNEVHSALVQEEVATADFSTLSFVSGD